MVSSRLVAIVTVVMCVALADEAFEWRKDAWSCSSTSLHREACVGEIGGAGIAAERALKLFSDELGESGPTQKASIFGYLSSLKEAQKQCPASRLQCPSSSVVENVPQQPKKKKTQKEQEHKAQEAQKKEQEEEQEKSKMRKRRSRKEETACRRAAFMAEPPPATKINVAATYANSEYKATDAIKGDGPEYKAINGLLDKPLIWSYDWKNCTAPFLELDFGKTVTVTSFMHAGGFNKYYMGGQNCLTNTLTLAYSTDHVVFVDFEYVRGEPVVFRGRHHHTVTHTLAWPLNARYLRFYGKSYLVRPALKVAVYGHDTCTTNAIVVPAGINANMYELKSYFQEANKWAGNLYGMPNSGLFSNNRFHLQFEKPGYWPKQWLQLDFGRVLPIVAVALQPQPCADYGSLSKLDRKDPEYRWTNPQCLKEKEPMAIQQFTVRYKSSTKSCENQKNSQDAVDCPEWKPFTGGGEQEVVFTTKYPVKPKLWRVDSVGWDAYGVSYHELYPGGVKARMLRIHPKSGVMGRWEVFMKVEGFNWNAIKSGLNQIQTSAGALFDCPAVLKVANDSFMQWSAGKIADDVIWSTGAWHDLGKGFEWQALTKKAKRGCGILAKESICYQPKKCEKDCKKQCCTRKNTHKICTTWDTQTLETTLF